MRALLVVVAAMGCRGGFDERVDAARAGDARGDARSDALADATSDAPVACPPGAMLCDGFESGTTAAWSMTDVSNTGTLTVETTTVHSGMYALHGTVGSGPSGNSAAVVETFPLESTGVLAVREWVYQPAALINYDGVIILEQAGGNPSALVGGDPSMLWDVTENSVSSGSVDHATTAAVVVGAWTCVELDYAFGSPSTITLYLNDALTLQVVTADPAPAYSQLYAGAARAQSGGTDTIIDDVVIAHQHIGCAF